MRLVVLWMGAATLSACAGSGATVTQPTTLTAAQRSTVEQFVRSVLKDPESARFGDIRAGSAAEGITICGQVNAKNSFGGYTGMTTFFGVLQNTTVANF